MRKLLKPLLDVWFVVCVVVAFGLFWVALAQGQSLPASQPLDPGDPWSVLETVLGAVQAHAWRVVVIGVLVLIVLGLRFGAGLAAVRLRGRLAAFFAWFTTDRGGAILTVLSGTLGALFLAVVAGKRVTVPLLEGGFTAGLAAAGGWTVVKRILWPKDKTQSTPTGK